MSKMKVFKYNCLGPGEFQWGTICPLHACLTFHKTWQEAMDAAYILMEQHV